MESKQVVAELNHFLKNAPATLTQDGSLERFQLPDGDGISCILYSGRYFMTGTDIVKSLLLRFEALGWTIKHTKKFEEGVFSDLRNLRPGVGCSLESPRSAFLGFLFDSKCVRTQKKQKVFYWDAIRHDELFMDALDRDLKRIESGQEPCALNLDASMTAQETLARASELSIDQLIRERVSAPKRVFPKRRPQKRRSSSDSESSESSFHSSPEALALSLSSSSSNQVLTPVVEPTTFKTFACSHTDCTKTFSKPELLRKHSKSHTTNKASPYMSHAPGPSRNKRDVDFGAAFVYQPVHEVSILHYLETFESEVESDSNLLVDSNVDSYLSSIFGNYEPVDIPAYPYPLHY